MKISVIIPVYNAGKYLEKCLNSVMSSVRRLTSTKGYENACVEVICIDDGSKDDSAEILEGFFDKQSCFIPKGLVYKILHQTNSGVVATRNVGIEVSEGDWICFVDADDWLDENTFPLLLQHANEGVDILIGGHTLVRGDERTYRQALPLCGEMTGAEYVNNCLKFSHGYIWGKLIRRNLCLNMSINPSYKLNEDLLINVITGNRARKVVCLDCNVYYYFWDLTIDRQKCTPTESIRSVLQVNRDVKEILSVSSLDVLDDGYVWYVLRNAAASMGQRIFLKEFSFYRDEMRCCMFRAPMRFCKALLSHRSMMVVLLFGIISVHLAKMVGKGVQGYISMRRMLCRKRS